MRAKFMMCRAPGIEALERSLRSGLRDGIGGMSGIQRLSRALR
jgi:hypothetical protein